jgi:predicted kinase
MKPPRKLIIQMSGAPGSGKSTIANQLARRIDGVVINHDLLKSFFLDTGTPFDQSAKLAYDLDWVLAEDLLKQGRSVIIDSVCNYGELLDKGAAVAKEYGCDYRIVQCKVADMELLDQRLRGRVAMRSQRTGVDQPPPDAVVDVGGLSEDQRKVFKEKFVNSVLPIASGVIVVDSSKSPEESVEYILKQLVF